MVKFLKLCSREFAIFGYLLDADII